MRPIKALPVIHRKPEFVAHSAKVAKTDSTIPVSHMRTLSAKEANCGFGRLIDLARAESVAAAVAKHGRPVVVVLAIEEYERLKAFLAALAEIGDDETTYDSVKQALIDGGAIKHSVLRSER